MNTYIGTKVVKALAMTRLAYNKLRNWELPEDENGEDEGCLVEYVNSKPNVEGFDGYVSWSPKAQFDEAYNHVYHGMTFGHAVDLLKVGKKVARIGWNGKNMFLFLVPGSTFKVNRAPLLGIYPEGTEINYHAHIDMKTASGEIVPWLASQSDILATDWVIVD